MAININGIDVTKLSIECNYSNRGKFTRMVYHSPADQEFIKIWKDDYYYREYFEEAYSKGFYKDIALITEVIVQDVHPMQITQSKFGNTGPQIMVGYITMEGLEVNDKNVDQNKYKDLIDRVAKACQQHQCVYIDLNVKNVVEKFGKYWLVDLEPVIPVPFLAEIPDLRKIMQYNNYYYRTQIAGLLSSQGENWARMARQHTDHEKEIKYGTANGRIFLEKEYLPNLTGSVLFIGVNYYTDFYCQLVKDPDNFHTLDIDPDLVNDGSPYGHFICDIMDFEFHPEQPLYDNVVFFGILGHADSPWEIKVTDSEIEQCIAKVATLVKPGGTLLIGPSTQTRSKQYWDSIYTGPLLHNYQLLTLKQIDINYIWIGKRIE